MNTKTLETYLQEKSALIEETLDAYLPQATETPKTIHEAMRYSVLGGGKRIRPVLTLAVSELFGGFEEEAIIPACAVELIHSYSLIHDDLPVMDNDDTRRGKASCHKKFGDAIALLAGDALLTHAFQLLATVKNPEKSKRFAEVLAKAAGTEGMIGGQVLDLEAATKDFDLLKLDEVTLRKTARLIEVSSLLGAISAGVDETTERSISRFGRYLGIAFQVMDDIIDRDGYLRLMTSDEAKNKAAVLIQKAKEELSPLGGAREMLNLISEAILNRKR
ncbi:MAG: polyprenyl synthetase family protein [Candidatus Omnitrophica bacterium]|nr:polyprenyl synthetase family protein [Candidatus Omnitrophota bacterium]